MAAVSSRFRAVFGGRKTQLPPLGVLVLGEHGRLPRIDGISFVNEPEAGFDVVAVTSPVSRAEVRVVLEKGRKPLAPVLDFGGALGGRADYESAAFKAFTLEEGLAAVLPLIERGKNVADFIDSPDADGLLVLGMAYTRDCPLAAEWDPQHPKAVRYPLLAGVPKAHVVLESLAELGLLRRRPFDRAMVCAHCHSSRLNAEEQCPACRSPDLTHDPSANPAYACRACGATTAAPVAAFVCVDCGKSTLAQHIETRDWFHYELNDDGVAAVRAGRLPKLRLEDLLKPYAQAQSVRDFMMLVDHGLKTAVRYNRPYSVFDIALGNAVEIKEKDGPKKAAEVFGEVLRILAGMLRTSDLVTAHDHRIVVALPETKASNAGIIMLRLRKKVSQGINAKLHLECRVSQGERALQIVESLR